MPVELGWVADGLLEPRRIVAVGDNIEPVTVPPILGDATLVGREQDRTCRGAEPLDLDKP